MAKAKVQKTYSFDTELGTYDVLAFSKREAIAKLQELLETIMVANQQVELAMLKAQASPSTMLH